MVTHTFKQQKKRWKKHESKTMPKRYCVFAAYNKENRITSELLFYLEELNKITDGVVFIMDNPIDETEEKKLNGLTIYHKCEKHNEYDFGSYKKGFFYLKENGFLDDTSEIIFSNDSCYGPLKPLNLFIEKWEKENKPDFYGITINNFGLKYSSMPIVKCEFPHIQSYFFLVTKNVFEKVFFQNFLGDVHHFDTILSVVKNYEMELSDLIVKNGFNLKAYFDFKDFKKDPTREGSKMFATIKKGFFIKKKNNLVKSKDKNLVNYFFQKSIFPYIFNKKGELVEKINNSLAAPVFLIRYLFAIALKNIFKIKNKGCAKVIAIFGINFIFKRYDYKISNICTNFIKIIDNNDKRTLKEKKIEGLEIVINGKRNCISIDKNTKFKNSKIEILADNCFIEINSENLISGLNVKLENANCQTLVIDKNTQISNLDIVSDKEDVLIEIKDGKISNNSAKIEKYIDDENRPRITVCS